MFTACSACVYLKNLLDRTGRDQNELLQAVRRRLGHLYNSLTSSGNDKLGSTSIDYTRSVGCLISHDGTC